MCVVLHPACVRRSAPRLCASFCTPCLRLRPQQRRFFFRFVSFSAVLFRINCAAVRYGPCGNHVTDDKPFMHKRNGVYYLSWGCFYATSKSVYGPFDTQGAVISTATIAPAFRMNNSIPPPAREAQVKGSPAAYVSLISHLPALFRFFFFAARVEEWEKGSPAALIAYNCV